MVRSRQSGGELEWIHADDARAQRLEHGELRVAAVGFTDAGEPVRRAQFEYRSQRVGGVQAVGTAEWRVGDRDRVDPKLGDDHAAGWALLDLLAGAAAGALQLGLPALGAFRFGL